LGIQGVLESKFPNRIWKSSKLEKEKVIAMMAGDQSGIVLTEVGNVYSWG